MHGKHVVITLVKNNEGARGIGPLKVSQLWVSGEFPNSVPDSLRRAPHGFKCKPGSEVKCS